MRSKEGTVVAMGRNRLGPARAACALAILGLLTAGAEAEAPAGKPDAVKAVGVFPITGETALVITGVPGRVVVTTKPARELRVTSRAKDRSGSERPLGLWFGGSAVTIAPPPGVSLADGVLQVEAPATLSVRVESQGGALVVNGFAGAVAIVSKGTAARAEALSGPLDAEVEGGSLSLVNLGGTATARLGATSSMVATNLRGGLDLKSQEATFKVQGSTGACRIEARGGSGELAEIATGGDLHLSGTPVRLTGGHGEWTVTSDAAVVFSNMSATLRFEMDGGGVQGKGNQGTVEVRGRRTEINLEAIVGAVRVRGEELKTRLTGIAGALDLDVTRGSVLVQRIAGAVTAVVFAGDAQFAELQGPVRLDIEGGNAELSWAAIPSDKDSILENRSGDIAVRLPAGAACRVTAKTKSGRITSEIPTIKAPADATEVQGAVGPGTGPTISIEANGNIRLSLGAGAPAPPS